MGPGRAASSEALAPEPPRATLSTPECDFCFPLVFLFFVFFFSVSFFSFFPLFPFSLFFSLYRMGRYFPGSHVFFPSSGVLFVRVGCLLGPQFLPSQTFAAVRPRKPTKYNDKHITHKHMIGCTLLNTMHTHTHMHTCVCLHLCVCVCTGFFRRKEWRKVALDKQGTAGAASSRNVARNRALCRYHARGAFWRETTVGWQSQ